MNPGDLPARRKSGALLNSSEVSGGSLELSGGSPEPSKTRQFVIATRRHRCTHCKCLLRTCCNKPSGSSLWAWARALDTTPAFVLSLHTVCR
eukprot:711561-Alexandrium_andersonii.AAC.1